MKKKKYEKPMIIIENFSLENTIASGCELITPLPSTDESCGYPVRGGVVFVDDTQCTTHPQDGVYNGFCYHIPTQENNVFNS